MSLSDSREPKARNGRMNRSRLTVVGISVGALVTITAGVAAANPAPNTKTGTKGQPTAARRVSPAPQTPTPSAPSFGSDEQGSPDWQQLPADPTPAPTDPALGTSADQTPTFDPNAGSGLGGSNTRSGGS